MLKAQLASRQIDLAFLLGPMEEPRVENLYLCNYPLSWVASPKLKVGRQPISLRRLAEWPVITYPSTTDPHRAADAVAGRCGVAAMYGSSALSVIVRMALDGIGTALIAPVILRRELAQGELRILDVKDGEVPPLHYTACWMQGPDSQVPRTVAEAAQQVRASAAPSGITLIRISDRGLSQHVIRRTRRVPVQCSPYQTSFKGINMNAITVARDSVALARQARLDARSGRFTGPTANLAPGHVQANLAILPRAGGRLPAFLPAQSQALSLLAMSEPGDPSLPELGQDIDIRSDIPRYRVWKHGELVAEPTDVHDWWRDDLVSFLIGCSFSFEEAMLDNGLPVRHIQQGLQRAHVPDQRADAARRRVRRSPGRVHAPLKAADAIRAIQVTSRFPSVHGAPVHLGDPSLIGIADIAKPDYGDAVEILPGEIPVFWACGVTPQSVVAAVKPEFCITHAPGHMLVTDLVNSQMAIL